MPPLPRISIGALARLAEELRFAPRDALERDVERIERLAAEIDPEARYPAEWVVFRVTGFRSGVEETLMVSGSELLRDLSALAERLSAVGGLRASEGAYTLDELALRWGVSTKTIERLRRRGLIARRVVGATGRSRLSFSRGPTERFFELNRGIVERASGYSRTDDRIRGRVIRCAGLYREAGLTLNQAAGRIALRYNRSKEAIRKQLIRHDQSCVASGRAPLFGWREPVRSSRSRWALEEVSRGREPRSIAREAGRSPAAVRRAVNVLRAERLRAELEGVAERRARGEPGVETLSGGVLDAPGVAEGIGLAGETDLLGFVRAARERRVPIGVLERAQSEAARELVLRAAAWSLAIDPSWPSPVVLDRAETALRWAARLRSELLRANLALVIETIEARAGLRLEEQRAGRARELVEIAMEAAGSAMESFDPSKGGRLAAPITMMVTRATARWMRGESAAMQEPAGRASPRLSAGVVIPDWTRRVASWQAWLEPDERVRGSIDAVSGVHPLACAVMGMRHGWREWCERAGLGACRPSTCAEVGARLGVSATMGARIERLSIRTALRGHDGGQEP
ncbi:MAG: hypothetical protein KF902_00705 [Phycisphaeraceae bacterium]|nr:hypothetical protein [Phycisphaeraceae bacterium]